MGNIESWHLSKTLTVSVIIGLMLNLISTVWWAANINSQVGSHEIRLTKIEESVSNDLSSIKQDVAVIKTILRYSEVDATAFTN